MRPRYGEISGTRVLALGHHQPAEVRTNDDLAKRVDTSDEWIRDRVGIAERRIAGPTETVTDMATAAAGKALAASGLAAGDIDLLIIATVSELSPLPNVACRVATRLGLDAPAAYDLNSACSGFSYALANASQAVLAGAARYALVVGVEKLSDWTDWDDRATCILFGDGAGAAIVGPGETEGIGPVVWGSDGPRGDALRIDGRDGKIQQEGQAVFRWATTALAPVAVEACRRAGIEPSDLAAFVPHQANLRIIDAIARRLGATDAVIARDIVESGNTSAASIPIALSKMTERGEVPSGAPVLLLGFGGGLTYAAQVVTCP
jgi:3-oxoacyl-[acyl-carrier-protein] synthase III